MRFEWSNVTLGIFMACTLVTGMCVAALAWRDLKHYEHVRREAQAPSQRWWDANCKEARNEVDVMRVLDKDACNKVHEVLEHDPDEYKWYDLAQNWPVLNLFLGRKGATSAHSIYLVMLTVLIAFLLLHFAGFGLLAQSTKHRQDMYSLPGALPDTALKKKTR